MATIQKPVVIAAYKRTPFTRAYKGELARVRPDEFVGQLIASLVKETKIPTKDIEDLILGCAFPEAEQGFNMARLVCFLADLDVRTAGMTLNRFCGSSMQAIHIAAGNIQMGAGDVFIAAGVESMSYVPMTGHNPLPHPDLHEKNPAAYMGMGETAENVAKKYSIDRAAQDAFGLQSQHRAIAAHKEGRFKDEISPVLFKGKTIDTDSCIRHDASIESLEDLNPAFDKDGSVTAGTSSPLTDGASAVLVTTQDYAEKHSLDVLARIKSVAVTGCQPEIMGIGPIGASRKALERAGIGVDDLDVVELNEAFAAQALAVINELGLDQNKVNIDGGAIALGHPLGASGARITGKAAQLLKREKGKYALATMCIGGGQGIATVLEAV